MTATTMRRILAAVKDPTAAPSATVRRAAQLAAALHAELVLFHAIEVPLPAQAYANDERRLGDDQTNIRREYLRDLETQAAALRSPGVAVSVAAEWDFPAGEALLRHAHAVGADLVVIGQAREHHAHATVQQVLRLSPLPVLLVRGADPWASPTLIAAVDPARQRGAGPDLNALICRQAQSISNALGGAWHIVAAAHGPRLRPRPQPLGQPAGDPARAAIARILPAGARAPRSVRIVRARAARAILEAAASLHAQLIVLGAASESELLRVLSGNTLGQIVAHGTQDILLVKVPAFGVRFSTRVRGPRITSAVVPPIVWYEHG